MSRLIIHYYNSSITMAFLTLGQVDMEDNLLSNAISFKLLEPNDHLSNLFLKPRQSWSAYRIMHPVGSTDATCFSHEDGKLTQLFSSTFNLNIFPKITLAIKIIYLLIDSLSFPLNQALKCYISLPSNCFIVYNLTSWVGGPFEGFSFGSLVFPDTNSGNMETVTVRKIMVGSVPRFHILNLYQLNPNADGIISFSSNF